MPVSYASSAFRVGDYGQEITTIQSQLSASGYDVGSIDGDFGSSTSKAVAEFQKNHGLNPDGIVGSETYYALFGRDIPVSRGDFDTYAARRIISTSMNYIGVPYVFGGTSPSGFDCSGFVRYVYARYGIHLPRMADEQYYAGTPVSLSRLQPGDLVFFTTYTEGISHSGIYIGDGEFISATSSRGVAIARMDRGYWGARYVGACKVL